METHLVMENNLFRSINIDLNKEDIAMLPPLQLAYIGDAVYELLVRTYLLKENIPVKRLHRTTIKYVKAEAQAKIIHALDERLSEEEKNLVKKGRNAKSKSVPKNANIMDYKYATGLEALFGYLYLNRDDIRIKELFDEVIKINSTKKEEG